jgi:hypothetical protein
VERSGHSIGYVLATVAKAYARADGDVVLMGGEHFVRVSNRTTVPGSGIREPIGACRPGYRPASEHRR